jgi:hypothetical protein
MPHPDRPDHRQVVADADVAEVHLQRRGPDRPAEEVGDQLCARLEIGCADVAHVTRLEEHIEIGVDPHPRFAADRLVRFVTEGGGDREFGIPRRVRRRRLRVGNRGAGQHEHHHK